MRYAPLGGAPSGGSLLDLDSKLQPFMEKHGWDAMIVRPDFYIYGGALGEDDRKALVQDLTSDLAAAGVVLRPEDSFQRSPAPASV